MANITGVVGHIIEVNLCLEWDMGTANGICFMEICTKVNTWMIRKMGKAHISGKMVLNILAHSKTTTGMVMVKCIGMTGELTKDNG